MMQLLTGPVDTPLLGELTPPGDKSISHRALIMACLARGQSRVEGLLDSADVRATAGACRQLGMTIRENGDEWLLEGVGADGLSPPDAALKRAFPMRQPLQRVLWQRSSTSRSDQVPPT